MGDKPSPPSLPEHAKDEGQLKNQIFWNKYTRNPQINKYMKKSWFLDRRSDILQFLKASLSNSRIIDDNIVAKVKLGRKLADLVPEHLQYNLQQQIN